MKSIHLSSVKGRGFLPGANLCLQDGKEKT